MGGDNLLLNFLAGLAVLLLAAWLWLHRHGPLVSARYDFVAKVDAGRVTITGRLTPPKRASLAEFLVADLSPDARFTVSGRRRRDRSWNLCFSGHIPPAERQRIRNFLATAI